MHHIVVFDYEAMIKAIFNNAEQEQPAPAPAPARQRKQQRKQRLTIYSIKYMMEGNNKFFDRETLKFFGQTMKSFKVSKITDKVYFITAPIIINNKVVGSTEKFFNVVTRRLTSHYPTEE